jgi:hypothetical protein
VLIILTIILFILYFVLKMFRILIYRIIIINYLNKMRFLYTDIKPYDIQQNNVFYICSNCLPHLIQFIAIFLLFYCMFN